MQHLICDCLWSKDRSDLRGKGELTTVSQDSYEIGVTSSPPSILPSAHTHWAVISPIKSMHPQGKATKASPKGQLHSTVANAMRERSLYTPAAGTMQRDSWGRLFCLSWMWTEKQKGGNEEGGQGSWTWGIRGQNVKGEYRACECTRAFQGDSKTGSRVSESGFLLLWRDTMTW